MTEAKNHQKQLNKVVLPLQQLPFTYNIQYCNQKKKTEKFSPDVI